MKTRQIRGIALALPLMLAAAASAAETKAAPGTIEVEWSLRGHASSSRGDRDRAALEALESKARSLCEAWNTTPSSDERYTFVGVALAGRSRDSSSTSRDAWTGKRRHEASGKARGIILYRVEPAR